MSKKLLRKEVYDKIWKSSVKETAEKYNVDYVDLLKVCHKANIQICLTFLLHFISSISVSIKQ